MKTSTARWFAAAIRAALFTLLSVLAPIAARAADPFLVISVTASGSTTVCDTGCTTCTVGSGECILVGEEDLILCTPTSSGLPITGCHWTQFLDGAATNLQINQQIRAVDLAPNGNIVFVALNDTTVPDIGALKSRDIAVLNPYDPFRPYLGGPPYDDGSFKLYLNGDLTQQEEVTTKPWDALSVLTGADFGNCEDGISATSAMPLSCPIIGSLTAGSGAAGLDGVHFENEDLLRCTPDGFGLNGTVESCKFSMFLEADRINGAGNGITTDIEAIDFVSFDQATMSGDMVFKMAGGSPPGFPAHNAGKDLLLYDGTFGAGNCVPSGNPCADDDDCPVSETCNTGTCTISATPCSSDGDCTGAGNTCAVTRDPVATVTKYFDGVAVGLTGAAQNIEGFAIVTETDGDGVPDGIDNCPNDPNPPSDCSGAGPETCPGGLSSECPSGETCQQADADGDGVGDVCDQCNGRDDAVCFCGDDILDIPSEQCDLGAFNGTTGSPCSATCSISGHCKPSGGVCTTAADCPSGEGCCGNDVTEANEGCDDGNTIDDDACTNICDVNVGGVPILGCEDLTGPNITAAFVKSAQFKDTKDLPDIDRWKTKGSFNFIDGIVVDPDSQNVRIIFNNVPSGELFSSSLPPGSFIESKPAPKGKWQFFDKEADVPGSPSWRKGKFSQKQNQIKFTLDGRNETLFTATEADVPASQIRQTIRIDDLCATALLTCAVKKTTIKCTSSP